MSRTLGPESIGWWIHTCRKEAMKKADIQWKHTHFLTVVRTHRVLGHTSCQLPEKTRKTRHIRSMEYNPEC